MIGFNGGLIGKDRTPSPRSTNLSGVWTLQEQLIATRRSTWSDPFFQSVYLLLHFDGANGSTTFTDSSSAARVVTAAVNARINTAVSKFDGSAVIFDGASVSDQLTFTDPALGTGNFTIEFWMKSNCSVQYAQIIGNEFSTNQGYTFLINNNSPTGGQITVYSLQANLVVQTSTGDWTDDNWHHIALVRSGTSFTLYTDGSANGTGTSSDSFNGSSLAYIGRNNVYASPSRNFTGYLDEFRITKGVARYTSNFTPPTVSFQDL